MNSSEIGAGKTFSIGPILVDPSRNILSRDSDIYPLEPKIMDVLEYLSIHQGKVCSRDDIIANVWNVEYGADESLTRAISVIRKAFRKAGGRGRYIQTISKRGYSLQEPISAIEPSTPKRATFVNRPSMPAVSAPLAHVKDAVTPTDIGQADSAALPMTSLVKQKNWKLGLGFAVILSAAAAIFLWQSPFSSENFGSELAISPYGRSVAILPFVDLSADKDNQYFSDGIAEELSHELGKINALRIVGHRLGGTDDTQNMSYKDIGNKLEATHIIHGSVRKQDNRVRISAQLISSENTSLIWSSNYNGTLEDIFDLQQRVALDIVTELSLVLGLEVNEPIEFDGIIPMTLVQD